MKPAFILVRDESLTICPFVFLPEENSPALQGCRHIFAEYTVSGSSVENLEKT